MIKILLACGAGCSSGLIAQSMKKYAKKRGIEYAIKAIGDPDIFNCVADYDVLMLGPHLAYNLPSIEKYITEKNLAVIVKIIDRENYSMLDGEAVFKEALRLLEEKKESKLC